MVVPTASYRVSGTATGTCQYNNSIFGNYWTHNDDYDENTVVVTGCDYKNQAGDGTKETDGRIDLTVTCEHGETETLNRQKINHSYATVWEAGQALQDGITVYSVALQAGTKGETILRNCATNPSTGFFAIDKMSRTLLLSSKPPSLPSPAASPSPPPTAPWPIPWARRSS